MAIVKRRRTRAVIAIVVGCASCAAVGPVAAAAKLTPPAPAVQTVLACREIKEDAPRLACFDNAVSAMSQAETQGDLLTLDREQRRAVRRQAFGLTLPALNLFDRGEKPEEVSRLTAKVASARQDSTGKWTIRLVDGAVWVQTDDNDIQRAPHAGSAVEIRKGTLGSFFMKVDGQQAVRVRRLT